MSGKSLCCLLLLLGALAGLYLLWPAGPVRGRETAEVPGPRDEARIARALKSPFRIFGRLFRSRRPSPAEKERRGATVLPVESFESSTVARLTSGQEEAGREKYLAETLTRSAREQLEEGRRLLRRGQYREATTILSRAASLDPSLEEARLLLATAFDLQGMRGRAATYYGELIARRERANDRAAALALNNQGYALYLQGNYEEALRLFSEAVRLDDADPLIWNNLGLTHYRLQKHREAYKAFARAGGETQGHLNVAVLLDRDGRDTEAGKYYERARRSAPDSELVRDKILSFAERRKKSDLAVWTERTEAEGAALPAATPQ